MLESQLHFASETITHDGVMGGVTESYYIQYIRKYLPDRYKIDTGIVIDSTGSISDQMNVIIYDRQYTPTLMDQSSHRYIPAEAVYAIIEVKPEINKEYLEYANNKATSVIALKRTSCPIPHAGGEYPPRPNFPIVCGIISSSIGWKDGFHSKAFNNMISEYKNLSFGHSVSWGCFDFFNRALSIHK